MSVKERIEARLVTRYRAARGEWYMTRLEFRCARQYKPYREQTARPRAQTGLSSAPPVKLVVNREQPSKQTMIPQPRRHHD